MLRMGSNHSATLNRFQTTLAQQPEVESERLSPSVNVPQQIQNSSRTDLVRNPAGDGHILSHNESRNSIFPYKERERGTLVVVKEAEVVDLTKDPTLLRLTAIPFFNPIILNRDKLTWSREGETIRQQLDSRSCSRIGSLVQSHLRMEATCIAKAQNQLTFQIKQVDQMQKQMIKAYTDRQKAFAKHAESLRKLNDFAHALGKCQAVLNDCLKTARLLNGLLPEAEKLEQFVWVEEEMEMVQMESQRKLE